MSRLVYTVMTSLDGYVSDVNGRFDWAQPDQEVHQFVNDLEREAGTYLYGRRLYDTMVAWESPEMAEGQPDYIRDYAEIWRTADKVVYSRTLDAVSSARTRIEREFLPDAIAEMKRDLERDILIGGPMLAAHAIEGGLVDEYGLLVVPVVVGGGTPAFPRGLRMDLTLVEERRFSNGVVYLRYKAS